MYDIKSSLPNMKFRLNLTQKFLLPIIVGLIILSIILGLLANNLLAQAMIDRAKSFIAEIITLQSKEYFTDPSYFIPNNRLSTTESYEHVFQAVKTKELVRMKIWGKDTTVVYSDEKGIIGKKFPDNKALIEAINGRIVVEITVPGTGETASERAFKQVMELYVPIYFENSPKPAGVVEVYYGLDSLNTNIANTSRIIYGLIAITFIILAVLIYMLAYVFILSPLKVLSAGIKDIENGNFDKKIPVRSSDEIGLLSIAFNEMTVGLKRLQELKNEFVFVAAHELRTPVTAIKGYISMIKDYPDLKLPDDINEDLNIIAQSAQSLNQLVGDILQIARADAGRLEVKTSECSLTEIVNTIILELTPLIKEKNLTLVYDKSIHLPSVLADPIRLKEVLMNLVSNAIKYNISNGDISINFSVEESQIVTHVENSGMGIPIDEQSHIFEKFYRAEAAKNSEIIGTGLGLFITKELVERMKGTISFTSEVGKRTIFSVSLPKS